MAKDLGKNFLPASRNDLLRLLYLEKRVAVEDRIALAAALNLAPRKLLLQLWQQLRNMEAPQFPVKGRDLLALEQVEAGPALGALLDKIEQWWIDKKFVNSREECLAQAQKILNDNSKNIKNER